MELDNRPLTSETEESKDREPDSTDLTDSAQSILMEQSSEKALYELAQLKRHHEEESSILASLVEVVKETQRISEERLGHIRMQEKTIVALKDKVLCLEGLLEGITERNRELRTVISKDRFQKFGNTWQEDVSIPLPLEDLKSEELPVGDYETNLSPYSPTSNGTNQNGHRARNKENDAFFLPSSPAPKLNSQRVQPVFRLNEFKKKSWVLEITSAVAIVIAVIAIFIYRRESQLEFYP